VPIGTKSLTVRLDDDLWRRLRYLSIDKGESLQKMVERLLREFVVNETRTPSQRKEAKRKG
jgi:predicted transcriptional regulator